MTERMNERGDRSSVVHLPNSPLGLLTRLRNEIEQSLGLRTELEGARAKFLRLVIGQRGLEIDEFTTVEFRSEAASGFAFVMEIEGSDTRLPLVTDDLEMMAQFTLLYIRERLVFLREEEEQRPMNLSTRGRADR